jgi:hypothetical protein
LTVPSRSPGTLTPGAEWHLILPGGAARILPAAHDGPPISAVIPQIDLHEDENNYTSGADD